VRSQASLDAVLAGLRDAHREFRAPLTNPGILRVLARERIPRRPAKLPCAAMTVMQYGRAAIVVDPDRLRNPREETAVLAEEYAHAKLHAGEHDDVTLHLSSCGSDDPREYEADYIARGLLAGPGVEIAYLTPPKRSSIARRPPTRVTVPPAFDPYATPAATAFGRRTPRYGGQDGETPLQRAMRMARPLPREMKAGPTSDHGIITHSPGRVRYVDREGREWTVWDVAIRDGVRTHVPAGAIDARLRYFVNASGGRRRYLFDSKRELRDVAERHFERQLREADVVQIVSQQKGAASA
jgi:hypothetical protein